MEKKRTINAQLRDVVAGTKTVEEIIAEGVDSYAIKYFDAQGLSKEMWAAFYAIKTAYDAKVDTPVAAKKETEEDKEILCDCGHYSPRRLVMSTSSGTSCPECYDKMSF